MSFQLKALVCDDSSVMRKILTEILEAEKFQVVAEAPDGIEAVRLCKLHKPNLVTLDIAMPGMDGISALKEIHKISPDIKIVMVTSLDRQELVVEALRNGAENYITKPYQAEKVARVINCIHY